MSVVDILSDPEEEQPPRRIRRLVRRNRTFTVVDSRGGGDGSRFNGGRDCFSRDTWIPLNELYVDKTVQREITDELKAELLSQIWEPEDALIIQVEYPRAKGRENLGRVLMGQHRVRALQMMAERGEIPWDTPVKCVVRHYASNSESAKHVADIEALSDGYSAVEYWRQLARGGTPEIVATERAMRRQGLFMSTKQGANALTCPEMIRGLLNHLERQAIESHVDGVLGAIRLSWPDDSQDSAKNRWRAAIIRTMWETLRQNDDPEYFSVNRLAEKIGAQRHHVSYWLDLPQPKISGRTTPLWKVVGPLWAVEYNNGPGLPRGKGSGLYKMRFDV